MLDFLTFSLCAPYSETTDGAQFDALLELVAQHAGRMLFKLFQHSSIAIVRGAGLVMKAIIEVSTHRGLRRCNNFYIYKIFFIRYVVVVVVFTLLQEGESELAAKMQDLALAEAALPRHLLDALYASGSESRLFALRELSRQLVGLWLTGHPPTMNALKRIMVR